MERLDCLVVGAGVVGLACARALGAAGREVVIAEREGTFGTGISSRNSENIHAGIYYPSASWKARTCIPGRRALYAFCESHGVPHARLGKLIVATDEAQHGALAGLAEAARANGVDDLQPLTAAAARELEPTIRATAALLSPSTGIVDSHGLMLALLGEAQARGAFLALETPILGGRAGTDGIEVEAGGRAPIRLRCRTLVNAAGLGAQALGRAIAGLPPATVPPLHYAKGHYFSYARKAPWRRLIYPVPYEAGGLGVHVTLDLGRQARFGPDVEWVETLDYDVDPARRDRFVQAIRRYYPAIEAADLIPGYSGIRPKTVGPEGGFQDFRIQGPADHGVAGLVNLYGIESPGLTACLAIAEVVRELAA